MHTVDLLERALATLAGWGYQVRRECLEDSPGGGCEIKGQKWLFLDLASSPAEQLEIVAEVLAREASSRRADLEPRLRYFLNTRAA